MSITLPAIDLSSAAVGATGTVDWSKYAPQAGYAAHGGTPHLAAYNESGCGLQLTFSTGEQAYLPAGGWVSMALNPACQSFTYQVVYSLTAPLVTTLLVVWFPPDEAVPPTPILGNSPVGGQVTTTFTIAQELEGQNQIHPVTTWDSGFSPYLVPTDNQTDIGLAGRAIGGGLVRGVLVSGAPANSGNVQIFQTIDNYNQEALSANGVPTIVSASVDTHVTTTVGQTLGSWPTPNDGARHTYRLSAYVLLANSVSGNSIRVTASFTDRNNAAQTVAMYLTNTNLGQNLIANGGSSFANGQWYGESIIFTAAPNTTVSFGYLDPTNTPNDYVTMLLERLA